MARWRSTALPIVCAMTLVLSGCSASGTGDAPTDHATSGVDDGPAGEADSGTDAEGALDEGGVDADAGDAGSSHPFPELPDEFPLPDEHMILRSFAMEGDPMGHSLEVAVATDGTIEEQVAFFEEALSDVYGDVEVTEAESAFDSHTLRFSGPGFEYGAVAIGENEGLMDSGDTDSSHLPVYLAVILEENPRE